MKSAALLFGLNYKGTDITELKGCVHDVRNMEKWLRTQGCSDIKVYEDETDPVSCTREQMTHHLKEFGQKTMTEDLDWVWIHYSGHGAQELDFGLDEMDGYDEAIVPRDAHKEGQITDDEIVKILNLFHPHTRVILCIDACHSGTVCDLPFTWDIDAETKKEGPLRAKGSVVLLSGCRDNQTSDDAYNAIERRYGGAFTDAFLSVVTVRPEAVENVFTLTSDIRKILQLKKHTQIVQLSSTIDFTINSALFPEISHSPVAAATPSNPGSFVPNDPMEAILTSSSPCCSIM